MKTELILTFAHDLRSCLRSIVVAAQRVEREPGELSVASRARLEEVLAAARRQEELIAAVVEYDQANLAGDPPLALRLIIQTACMKVDAYRQARGGVITFDSKAIPKVLAASGMSRVLEKILHNSLKFQTADAHPLVRLDLSKDDDGRITISVRDNGIGIEPAYWELVLEPFKRLNPASQFAGSGMGLAICKRLLESIGGAIRIDGGGVVISVPKLQP